MLEAANQQAYLVTHVEQRVPNSSARAQRVAKAEVKPISKCCGSGGNGLIIQEQWVVRLELLHLARSNCTQHRAHSMDMLPLARSRAAIHVDKECRPSSIAQCNPNDNTLGQIRPVKQLLPVLETAHLQADMLPDIKPGIVSKNTRSHCITEGELQILCYFTKLLVVALVAGSRCKIQSLGLPDSLPSSRLQLGACIKHSCSRCLLQVEPQPDLALLIRLDADHRCAPARLSVHEQLAMLVTAHCHAHLLPDVKAREVRETDTSTIAERAVQMLGLDRSLAALRQPSLFRVAGLEGSVAGKLQVMLAVCPHAVAVAAAGAPQHRGPLAPARQRLHDPAQAALATVLLAPLPGVAPFHFGAHARAGGRH
mmetsp:Transcript_82327/g.233200  ORF Transcript_82327/g.233200 Transcript_82327/m.233200 type:complete len:368 (-) Transcript_82327:1146-2249(-)